ncbi:MAG: type I-G CRISPR-associated helicase/endonuclease Cas3g [Betaproteobacteria bacterium]
MMQDLRLEAFSNFYTEVHGKDKTPFAWQTDLLAKVVADRRWPSVIDLPTGAGKTSCIDIALFALALGTSDEIPWCPRRIAMVVDRRVVVDQAARRGQRIAQALLHASPGSVCAAVAERLAGLSTEGTPLRVAVLRGGIPRDAGWARTPDQPLVIASTVDQLGSRLLFRGYGVSWSMRPVHAGLIGNDTLILLDEVHLSRPFAQTLQVITTLRNHGQAAVGLHIVALSATPGATKEKPFRLPDVDRKKGAIAQRISAKKPARLVECDGRDALVQLAAKEAASLLKKPGSEPHRTVAVVVNRVDTAHRIARELRLNTDLAKSIDVVLLTGRMRPLDRDDRVRELELRVAADTGRRAKDTVSRPVIVVATQCIEAGADFDFDALVTEHASLDALRQRFGRVDRLGEYERAEALVIAVREPNDTGKMEVPKNDPIYGESLAVCWKALLKWRGKKVTLGFGIVEIEAKLNGQSAEPLLAPKSRAPALFPDYLKLWAQTAPPPYVEPNVPLFLHGPQAGPADVQVVWRQDLDDEDVWKKEDGEDDEVALARVAALPPSSLEAVSVPFVAAKRWLSGEKPRDAIVDLDRGAANQDEREEQFKSSASFVGRAVMWRGEDSFVLSPQSIGKLQPGDTVVLPASRGGLYDGSFDSSATSAVSDFAERASFFGRGLAVLRRYDPVLKSLRIEFAQDRPRALEGAQTWITAMLGALGTPLNIEVDESFALLKARRRIAASALTVLLAEDEEITQAETSSFTGRAIKLSAHSQHVETWSRNFAAKLRLALDLIETLAFAGWLHDVGKADPRFQQLLRGGSDIDLMKDRLSTPDDWLLAKSGMNARERRRTLLAARRSGYPAGTRHEVLSLAMIQNSAAIREEAQRRGVKDMDLLFHLVASHHGWCRPFAPAVTEPAPDLTVDVRHGDITLSSSAKHDLERLDSPLADRFALLGQKYGWLQLAWFETILRLADHRASEQETTDDET